MSLPEPKDDHLNKARGKCSLCGCDIGSATAKYCVRCYKECLKRCPECTSLKGTVTFKYQRHKGGQQVCMRCGEKHEEDRQLLCPTCNNERVIFVLPKTLEETL